MGINSSNIQELRPRKMPARTPSCATANHSRSLLSAQWCPRELNTFEKKPKELITPFQQPERSPPPVGLASVHTRSHASNPGTREERPTHSLSTRQNIHSIGLRTAPFPAIPEKSDLLPGNKDSQPQRTSKCSPPTCARENTG